MSLFLEHQQLDKDIIYAMFPGALELFEVVSGQWSVVSGR